MDYIDLLWIHRCDRDTPREETMKALHDLVESGKVRYIGASSMRAYEFIGYQNVAEKHNWTKFIAMQDEISLLYREEEREMIPYCKETGVGLTPWGRPLLVDDCDATDQKPNITGPLKVGKLSRPLAQSESTV